jgi:flagellar protein FlgJ
MIQGKDIGGRLALDARNLDALRLQAKRDPERAAKGAAQQFEALFLQTLLKSMRDATPQDGLMDSEQTRMYTSMLDQQLAQSLSARGTGLAELMLRQLRHNGAAAAPAAPAGAAAAGIEARAPAPVAAPRPAADPPGPERINDGRDFLMRMKAHALEASRATGIPARFLLGQAALESGWGKHEIRAADGSPSHNLFGIKAGRGWNGATVDVVTTEYVDGVAQKLVQKFRAYGSYAEGFRDYAALMQGNSRYAAVLGQRDAAGFAQGLQRAGYATDPRYADKLTGILNGARMRRTIAA